MLRDGVWPLSALYYALPPAVIASIAIIGRGATINRRRHVWTLAVIATLTHWYLADIHTGDIPRQPHDDAFRLMHWNVFFGRWGHDRLFDVIDEYQPDVFVMVEANAGDERWHRFLKERMPNHEMTALRNSFVVLSSLPIVVQPQPPVGGRLSRHITVTTRGGEIEVILCHPKSRPWLSRRKILNELTEYADQVRRTTGNPVTICGDLNTPAGSVHFDQLRQHFRLASEEPNAPYKPTWPMPVPVLTLDQIWFSDGLDLAGDGCQHPWTTASDHKPVVVDFVVRPKPTAGPFASNGKRAGE